MTGLIYQAMGAYLDTKDNRNVLIVKGIDENKPVLCINKLVTPSDCLNPAVAGKPDFQPSKFDPVAFYREASRHSCNGVYWHAHLPIDVVSGESTFDLDRIVVDGWVRDLNQNIGVRNINPIVEEVLIPQLRAAGYEGSIKEALWYQLIGIDPEKSFVTFPETPYTASYFLNEGYHLFDKTKTCGHTRSDDEVHMANTSVKAQFDEKKADIRRLLPEINRVVQNDNYMDLTSGMDFIDRLLEEELDFP